MPNIRDELKSLATYKSGDFYMGGIAMSKAMSLLHAQYGVDSWTRAIDRASDHEIQETAVYLQGYLDRQRKSPMRVCPCCKRPF